jgi:hypothetical protein
VDELIEAARSASPFENEDPHASPRAVLTSAKSDIAAGFTGRGEQCITAHAWPRHAHGAIERRPLFQSPRSIAARSRIALPELALDQGDPKQVRAPSSDRSSTVQAAVVVHHHPHHLSSSSSSSSCPQRPRRLRRRLALPIALAASQRRTCWAHADCSADADRICSGWAVVTRGRDLGRARAREDRERCSRCSSALPASSFLLPMRRSFVWRSSRHDAQGSPRRHRAQDRARGGDLKARLFLSSTLDRRSAPVASALRATAPASARPVVSCARTTRPR